MKGVYLKWLGCCFLVVLSATAVCGYLETPSEMDVELEYDRITLGGGESFQGRLICSDSITLTAGGNIQKSARFEVQSVKPQGNNGVATAIGSDSVYLGWTASAEGTVVSYTILRSTSLNGTYEVVVVLDDSVWEYTDDGLDESTTYFYKVIAEGSDSSSWTVFGPIGVTTPENTQPSSAADGNWEKYR